MPDTILLVDDSATTRTIIKVYLAGLPFEYLEADRAERGLELLGNRAVQLVIADVTMPGMGGLEFVRAVRADLRPHIRQLPVILLTGQSSPDIREQGVAAGANEFVLKPVSSPVLRSVIQKLLPAVG